MPERPSLIRPIRASRLAGCSYAIIGVVLLLGAFGGVQGEGTGPLLRLIFGSVLLTTGGAWLVPTSGRTVVLGWALRVAGAFFWLAALVVGIAWLWRG